MSRQRRLVHWLNRRLRPIVPRRFWPCRCGPCAHWWTPKYTVEMYAADAATALAESVDAKLIGNVNRAYDEAFPFIDPRVRKAIMESKIAEGLFARDRVEAYERLIRARARKP